MKKKRLICPVLIVFILSCTLSGALGDHLSGLAQRYENGEAVELSVGLSLTMVPGMNAENLETVNAWLQRSGITVRASLEDGGETGQVLLTFDGIDVLEAQTLRTPEGTLTVFPESGRAYRSAGTGFSFLESMPGDDSLPVLSPGWEEVFLLRLVPRFWEIIESGGGVCSENTGNVRIKNVGTSPMQTVFTLPAENANALWPGLTAFFAAGGTALLAYRTLTAEKAAAGLEKVLFTDTVTLTRLYDADGRDMGLTVTGRIRPGDGSERKLSLTVGFLPGSALAFSLSMPSVKGSLTDKWVFSAVRKETSSRVTWTLDGGISRTDSRGTVSLDLEGTLKEFFGETDAFSGKIALSGRVYGIRKSWTVRPEISAGPEGAAGSVRLTVSTAGDTDTDLLLSLALSPCGRIPAAEYSGETDITALGEEELQALLVRETLPLLRVWMVRMDTLTAAQREELAHVLRNDAWMNGPVTVGPPDRQAVTEQDNEWSVEEDSQ